MKKLFYAAHTYMILGLVGGLYYREITKLNDFTGDSQLGLVHTHVLALGMLFFLIAMALEKQFSLSAGKLFNAFYWTYNAGLVITVTVMTVRGTQTVLGHHTPEAAAAIAGIGHITLTVGLIFFFINLGKRIALPSSTTGTAAQPETTATEH
ncbi:DUF2871 domain-containing protein [Actinomadura barringtoniae]|uniref:DUF2871 domain-containing protein n=1 Tax=Actinomadura barringtoniae TaxID=1427535 RepID=A0A939T7I2_9ACTN|nr:DUF2871 domain-containing protein [Actinomadura barringtoniae]MBO2453143.1 DUF2871 domain-containing protein [Actinomadura barringtoniae]